MLPTRVALAFSILAALLACGASPARAQSGRIVTLVPSLGEDAFAIGAQVVGVSAYTDVPRGQSVARVADFQSVDVERIVALHPSVVVGIPSQARFLAPLRRTGIRVVLVADDSYDDIFADIRELGVLSGREAQAQSLVSSLQRETARLHARAAHLHVRPSVFVALGTGPVWTVGRPSYVARLIALAGGRNAADDLQAPWGEYGEESLLRAQPDVIVTGRDTHLRDVLDREPWRSLRAVREGHVFVTPDARIDDALFRPGPRYNEGLRWLIERLSSLSTPTT